MANLGKYLTPSKVKLESKGVASVRSRVINLTELVPTLTVAQMAEAMVKAAEKVYGLEAKTLSEADFDEAEIEKRYQRFSSFDWNYGKSVPCSFECAKRFSWGEVTIQLAVKNGLCEDAAVYSDAMDAEFAAPVSQGSHRLPFPLGRALRLCKERVRMCRRSRRSVPASAIAGNLSGTFFPIPNRKTGWFTPSGFLCAFFVSHAQHFRMRFLFLASRYASQNSFLVTLTHLPAFLSFFFMLFEFCRSIFFKIHGTPLANRRRILYSKTCEMKSVRPAHT